MSREILFRGKSKEDYGLIYKKGDWVKGNLIEGVGGKDDYYINPKGTLINIRVEAETVGQYTNAVDCNKKKVFEGDLIQNKDGKNVIGVVEWYKSECRFVAKINIPNEEINCFEVIGNKWDNPELAEKILDFYNEYERNNK